MTIGAPAVDDRPIDLRRVLAIAAPASLAGAAVPLQGAIDVAVVGSLGDVAALGGVGLGAEVFALLIGSLNFLQIATSGLAAQALGRRDGPEVGHVLARAVLVALAIAAAMLALRGPIGALPGLLFAPSDATRGFAEAYVAVRIWGAPAALATYAFLGWFAGQELTRRLVILQLTLAGVNIALSLWFVLGLGRGVVGVAAATAIAEWVALAVAVAMARTRGPALGLPPGWRPRRADLLARAALLRLFALNRDLFMRTLLLIAAFTWMARQGAQLGDATLAVNVVLFQFFIVSAYALDGFAVAAETLVGQSIGARSPERLDRAVGVIALGSAALAAALALGLALASGPIVDLFTVAPEIRALARDYVLWAALIPLAGVAAFVLDGVFVGATGSAEMRNSMILAALVYFPLSAVLSEAFGNHGVWAALWVWLGVRATTLGAMYPRVRARATA